MVLARVHCPREVQPRMVRRKIRRDGVHRHRGSVSGDEARVDERAAPEALLLRGARLRGRAVEVGAGPLGVLSEEQLLLLLRGQRGEGQAAAAAARSARRGGLGRVPYGAAGAGARAEASKVCGRRPRVQGAAR